MYSQQHNPREDGLSQHDSYRSSAAQTQKSREVVHGHLDSISSGEEVLDGPQLVSQQLWSRAACVDGGAPETSLVQ